MYNHRVRGLRRGARYASDSGARPKYVRTFTSLTSRGTLVRSPATNRSNPDPPPFTIPTPRSAALRLHFTYVELTSENCSRATTITLLRERAHDLFAIHKHMKRIVDGSLPDTFFFYMKDADGDA